MTPTDFQIIATKNVKYKVTVSDVSIAIANVSFMALKPKTIPWTAITQVELKKALASTHVNVVFHYSENGKQKKVTVMMQPFDKLGAALFKELHNKIDNKLWQNNLVKKTDPTVPLTLPLTKRFYGQYMARASILWVWGILSIGILPLPYFLYLILTKGLTATVSLEGITVKKCLSRSATWSEIQKVDFSFLQISHRSYGVEAAQSQWGVFTITKNSGKKIKFSLKTIDAAILIQKLISNNFLPKSLLDDCVVFG